MKSIRASIVRCCFALLVAGCAAGQGNGPSGAGGSGAGGVGDPGTGGDTTGAAGTGTTTGSGGDGNSGTGGSVDPTGSGGDATSGAAGSGTSGSAGSGPGASSGGGTGGSRGGNGGSTAGSAAGGTSSGGASGSPGAGGSATGGTTSGPVTLAITSSSSTYWKMSTPTESTANADVTVMDTAAQTWEGFGGSFNEKGWTYLNTKALQDEAMGLLFGTDGCRFAWGRIPMGASDYATDRYTCNENKDDFTMSKFSIDRDKMKLIPFIQAAQAVKPDLRFWASPWTPPTWMKSNAGFDGGNMKTDDNVMKAHAQYFVKFVQEYAKVNIKVEAVAPQNEPNFSQGYPSCIWATSAYTSFVGKYLGPAFTSAGLTTKIMLGTMSKSDGGADMSIVTSVMGDATAKPFVSVIGVQWGMAENIGNYKSYNLPVWVTEHKCGNYPWNPSGYPGYVEPAPNDYNYAKESWGYLRSTIKGGVTAYNAWNMVLDKAGKGIDTTRSWSQNALLVVDGGKITKTPTYYVFRHLSQYADPGAKVLNTSSNDAIGFKNPDGSVVAVLYAGTGKTNFVVALGGKKLQFDMPSGGWATVKYKP